MFDNYIDNLKNDMINELTKVISYKSISVIDSNSKYPFGEECNKCLNYVLDLAKSLGFRTKNVDGYCGYIEFGEGEELIGLIGHLDVVPVNDDWKYEPFNAKVVEGKIYGRGAIDDKGPVIASIYAMKAVMDTCKVHKRVRLILGLNEETQWKCIKYYKEHEEMPSMGFSPDADFPVIYAEKGILTYFFEQDYILENDKLKIKKIESQEVFNVVPKICTIDIETSNVDEAIEKVHEINQKYKFDIDIRKIDNEKFQIVSHGKSAHAAHPDLGENAVSKLIIILNDLFEIYNCKIEIFELFKKYVNTEYDGKSLEIDYKDESGNLTLNTAKLIIQDNKLKIGFNLRIPVHTKIEEVEEKIKSKILQYNSVKYEKISTSNPLYIDPNSELITKLLGIYNRKTNSNEKPIAIGGATYARAFKNVVSFGANMPGHVDMCHQNDEYIEVDGLILASKIYAEAIYELSK